MKDITMKKSVLFALFALFLILPGCSSDPAADTDRLNALEVEVKALRTEADVREKALREELAMIRVNLDGIQSLLKMEKGRAEALDTKKTAPKAEVKDDDLDNQLDTKAKTFVSENLDRLLVITKKLLDKMEQELDEQMKEPAPKPEGDDI